MTFEEQWLSMAVGALRAAGLAAAALGYHVWRLLTKQGSDADIEDYDEVLVLGLTASVRLLPSPLLSLLPYLFCRRHEPHLFL